MFVPLAAYHLKRFSITVMYVLHKKYIHGYNERKRNQAISKAVLQRVTNRIRNRQGKQLKHISLRFIGNSCLKSDVFRFRTKIVRWQGQLYRKDVCMLCSRPLVFQD